MRMAGERGQATVEFVLVLPLLVAIGLTLVQGVLVLRDHLIVVHAAREAARVASVEADPARASEAAASVLPGAVVETGPRPPPGGFLPVTVRYRIQTRLPVVGRLLPDPWVSARTVMRVER